MQILYSNILPLGVEENQKTIIDAFQEQLQESDQIDIAVGYTSNASLEELDRLVYANNIKHVCLNIGMYYIEGMPENAYHTAIKLNQKWMHDKRGEIRMIKSFKYHGKAYCFYKNGKPFSAILGSANLGVIKLEASNRRQYELSALITTPDEVISISEHINALKAINCSDNIDNLISVPLIREKNTALNGVELVTSVPKANIDFYSRCQAYVSFFLKLKVPKTDERHLDDGKHFTKSNINVCYAAPRNKRKARDWYETQLTVGSDVYRMEGYPEKNHPFFVITDDGYWFKAHTTSDNNKQFSAVGDELIMGRWLKGRLAAAGIVKPVNNTLEDIDRQGMITQEMLDEYGCDRLVFKKTGQTALDTDGTPLDVWMLSFTNENNE